MNDPKIYSATYLFRDIRKRLEKQYPAGEARQLSAILLEHFCDLSVKDLVVAPNTEVAPEMILKTDDAVIRLLNHEPVQYITGRAYFCGHEFFVNPDVLIPRPETEELVRWILNENSERSELRIADIGTGSGCIAISLALRLLEATVDAYDVSSAALSVAKQNNSESGSQVNFHLFDFQNKTEWPDKKYDIVVSNPPYIPAGNKSSLPLNVSAYEPGQALFVPDTDPLLFYMLLADFAGSQLEQQGKLYVEVHEDYADKVVELFMASGLCQVALRCDVNGKKRMVRAGRA